MRSSECAILSRRMLDQLAGVPDLAAFALIAAFVAGDSVVPAVPGETATLTGAVLAARGELSLLAVFAATWLGAVVGDALSFGLGRTAGRRAVQRRGERVAWARERLHQRGPLIILTARFIPGGRNAVSLAAGTLGMRWATYAVWDVLAAGLWALFAVALGYASGRTFADSLVIPLGLSLCLAALIGAAGELAVRRSKRGPL
jgi:membrane protein DedA with SNARE-associated domain